MDIAKLQIHPDISGYIQKKIYPFLDISKTGYIFSGYIHGYIYEGYKLYLLDIS